MDPDLEEQKNTPKFTLYVSSFVKNFFFILPQRLLGPDPKGRNKLDLDADL